MQFSWETIGTTTAAVMGVLANIAFTNYIRMIAWIFMEPTIVLVEVSDLKKVKWIPTYIISMYQIIATVTRIINFSYELK